MNTNQEFDQIKDFVNDGMGLFKKPSKKSTFKYNDDNHHESLKRLFLNSRISR